ncbi:MAG TPA: hypothetical protein VEN29_12405 [Casimicrobiaceae bacterium]|nr:hypothetical protein [Casimicrobiaceae bacterium]
MKPKAFHPDAAGLCSVMVTTGLANKAIQLIAAQYVTPHRKGLKLLGYAGVSCSSVRGVGLDARYDEPPPKHANIFGYPDDREKMMERAMLLAATATFQKL